MCLLTSWKLTVLVSTLIGPVIYLTNLSSQGRVLRVFGVYRGCSQGKFHANAMRTPCIHRRALRAPLCIQGDVMAQFAGRRETGVEYPMGAASVDPKNTQHTPLTILSSTFPALSSSFGGVELVRVYFVSGFCA